MPQNAFFLRTRDLLVSQKNDADIFLSTLHPLSTVIFATLLSCCLTSTEARWPIRDGDRVGRGRECERLDRGNRPKKTGETVDRRQNKGSVKAVSPRHCPATCALSNCCFNCCAGQSHYDNVPCTAVDEQLGQPEAKDVQLAQPGYDV